MYTTTVLHKLLTHTLPSIHSVRLNALMAAVDSLACGAKASVTSLGRGLEEDACGKHKIKRMDRLVSNRHLYQERLSIYSAKTGHIVSHVSETIIAIDRSPLCADQS